MVLSVEKDSFLVFNYTLLNKPLRDSDFFCFDMAAPTTTGRAQEIIDDESLAEEVLVYLYSTYCLYFCGLFTTSGYKLPRVSYTRSSHDCYRVDLSRFYSS